VNKATIKDIAIISTEGPWDTKSNAKLHLLLNLNFEKVIEYLGNKSGIDGSQHNDIRGLRIYKVSQLKKGAIGANEWHKYKKEIAFTLNGQIKWTFRDTDGLQSEYLTDSSSGGVFIPTNIFHTYEALEDESDLLVIANTTYDESKPQMHDAFPIESF